jgi:hypothetical protein
METTGRSAAAACLVVGLLLAVGAQLVAGQEPKMERLSIEDGSTASEFYVAEATVTTSDKHADRGGTSMLFHIDVDHFAGQPDYPIGWPRTGRDVPEDQRDWTGYDFLELVIHVETSREALPRDPLGLIVYVPDKPNAYSRTLAELRKGETTRIVVPMSDIPRHHNVTRIQFFISESNYAHGDVLDFYIDDIALTRYAEPFISDLEPLQSVAFSDASHLGVQFRLLGVEDGKQVAVTGRLRQGEEVIGKGEWQLGRGEQETWIELTAPPKAGEASLEVFLGEPREVAKVRFVESPFAEAGGE